MVNPINPINTSLKSTYMASFNAGSVIKIKGGKYYITTLIIKNIIISITIITID
jgi:hypothetical protein